MKIGSKKLVIRLDGKNHILTLGDSNICVYYYIDIGSVKLVRYAEGIDILSPDFTPSKEGWTFVGWREDTAANPEVLTSKTMGTQNIKLYAVYKRTVTLTYYDNSTSAKTKTGTAIYNAGGTYDTAKFTMTQSSSSGWTARGWSTINKGDATVQFINGSTIGIYNDLTIYGLYEKDITLSYNGNSATSGTTSSQTGTRYWAPAGYINPSFTLRNNGFIKSGYDFTGWNLGAPGTVITLSESTTAYAQWELRDWTWVDNYVGSGDTFKLAGNNLNLGMYGANTFRVISEDGDTDDWTGAWNGTTKSSSYYTNTVSTRGCKYITVTMTAFGNIAEYMDCDMMYLADANGNKIASFGFKPSQGWNVTTVKTLDCSAYSSIQLRGYFNDYEQYGSAIHVSTVQFSN